MTLAPYYIIFAGVNGAGKSTLFRTGLWQNGAIEKMKALPRVNPDEISVAHGWDSRSPSAQLEAGRIAIKQIEQHLTNRESFNQETTLCGKASIRNIRRARALGFRIIMFYVGLDNPGIANDRVARRDALGGHFIEPDIVTRRYETSLTNLVESASLCEEVYLYDNSRQLELEACFAHDVLVYFNPFEPHLDWVARITEALGYVDIEF